MVGHLGSNYLTAVGLSNQVVTLVSSFFTAVATGSTALVARYTGSKDRKRASETLQQSMLLGLIIGLVATLVGVPLAGQAMVWLQAGAEVRPLGATYLQIASFSYALIAMMAIGNGALRGAGDTKTPLLIMGTVNILNIAVTYILLHGMGPIPPWVSMGRLLALP